MNTYVETFVLRSSQCDMYGAWKPSAILECMQESAGVHSALFGLDRAAMNGMGIAWVLSRVKVHMDRVPLVGESITDQMGLSFVATFASLPSKRK